MHEAARSFIQAHATDKDVTVLECGSLDINGNVRDLFPNATWTGVDAVAGPGVDVVDDFAYYHHPHEVDYVICCEVLEHTPGWQEIIKAAADNLRIGGILLLTAAGPGRAPHSAIDENPIRSWEHYANIDPTVLHRALSEHFKGAVMVRQVGFDVQAWAIK